jgi:carboxylesterase type B
MPRSDGLFTRAAMESGAFGAWQSKPLEAAQEQYSDLLNLTGCFGAGTTPPDAATATAVTAAAAAGDNEGAQPRTEVTTAATAAAGGLDSSPSSSLAPPPRNITAELRCLQKLDLKALLRHADHAGSYSDSLDTSRYAPVIDGTV